MKNVANGWAVLCKQTSKESLISWGNGQEFQYPIFQTRKDAISWKKRTGGSPGKILKVRISY